MAEDFIVEGTNAQAPFTLKAYRGDGMTLLAMNWKKNSPPSEFVGFAIEYKEPGATDYYQVRNRINFAKPDGGVDDSPQPTTVSPVQMFRWVHFPRNANLPGPFAYRVTPLSMDAAGTLSSGPAQEVSLVLGRETYPGELNIAFTRGFVSSQAFVDLYGSDGPVSELLPATAAKGLDFTATHPDAQKALPWMGFEARQAILDLLDEAIADTKAQVGVIAYDFNEPEVVDRVEKLGNRVRVIIDDSADHGASGSAENEAAVRITKSAGAANVKRQHMGNLQHNKTVIVTGPKANGAIGGSTNFSWRGFYIQSNNAVILRGAGAIKVFSDAFENYWKATGPADFTKSPSAGWNDLKLTGIDAKVAFSPHSAAHGVLQSVADDIKNNTTSSLFYSLAFLYQTPGAIEAAIKAVESNANNFVYGVSDRAVGGLDLHKPDGNLAPVFPEALTKTDAPEPFKSEPTGGGGIRLHHKFVVIDFDKPTARVYLGSYNFSTAADNQNGENLLLIKDRKAAVSYMIEAVRIFDHYHFRVNAAESKAKAQPLVLAKPPKAAGDKPWFAPYFEPGIKQRDRILFG